MDEAITQGVARLRPNPPANASALRSAEQASGVVWPDDYRSVLMIANGGEGFLSDDLYMVLWPAEQIHHLNEAYGVRQYAPGLLLFGSNAGGDAYAFDMREQTKPVVTVPFVGMDLKRVEFIAPSLLEVLRLTMRQGHGHAARPDLFGKEVFEIKPIILGGHPTDPRNKAIVGRQEHIELVRYWNRLIRSVGPTAD